MRRRTFLPAAVIMVAWLVTGCADATAPTMDEDALIALGLGGPNPRPQIWADDELFNSVVPTTSFKPTSGNFDELYTGGNGFKDGVPLISDSKPGDRDYNGGRWHKNVLKAGVDPDKYADASSVDDLDLADFESTDEYFECPMLPRRGRH